MLEFVYRVIEHGGGEPPEPFGGYTGSPDVKSGDEIQLKWPDGRDAYKVKLISRDGMTLHVGDALP
jgi:hypothetical protein